jgi:hypothetical protein
VTPFRHAQQPLGADRLIGSFDADTLDFTETRSSINKSRRRRAEHHPTRRRGRLHPLSHPELLTNGGVTERA